MLKYAVLILWTKRAFLLIFTLFASLVINHHRFVNVIMANVIIISVLMRHQLMVIGPICLMRWALLFVATPSFFFSSSFSSFSPFLFSSFSSSSSATSLAISSGSSPPPMAGGAMSWLALETSIPVSPASALSYIYNR